MSLGFSSVKGNRRCKNSFLLCFDLIILKQFQTVKFVRNMYQNSVLGLRGAHKTERTKGT